MALEENNVKIKFESQWKISELESEINNCSKYDILSVF
jgi:hypothetical protein